MTTLEEQGEQEKSRAESVIAATPMFNGVDTVRVELGDNYEGELSLWVTFKLLPDFQADHPWVEAFVDYETEITLKLIHSGINLFPYTRIEPAA